VFRNIELTGASAVIQPVDLRILKHDRRAAIEVRIDATCRIERRAIVCNERQSSGDYRISVIPEAIAREGGGSALQATLGRTLATARRLLP
jgi:colicin import membrane protein